MTPRWTALLTVAASFVPLAALDAPQAERLLSRRYDEGERVQYVMKGQNDGSTYEVRITATTKKASNGRFVEEFAWSDSGVVQDGNLLRCFRGELEQDSKSRRVPRRIGIGGDIQLGDEVSPAKQLAAQRSLALREHGEIGEVQDALVTPPTPARIRRSKELAGTMHFVRDHQDLLVDRERRPSFE